MVHKKLIQMNFLIQYINSPGRFAPEVSILSIGLQKLLAKW